MWKLQSNKVKWNDLFLKTTFQLNAEISKASRENATPRSDVHRTVVRLYRLENPPFSAAADSDPRFVMQHLQTMMIMLTTVRVKTLIQPWTRAAKLPKRNAEVLTSRYDSINALLSCSFNSSSAECRVTPLRTISSACFGLKRTPFLRFTGFSKAFAESVGEYRWILLKKRNGHHYQLLECASTRVGGGTDWEHRFRDSAKDNHTAINLLHCRSGLG